MSLEEFVNRFAEEFDDTPKELFKAETRYRELDEWSSLSGLSIISMVDDEFDKQITGSDLRKAETIKDLYEIIKNK